MKSVDLFCASPASTAICSSMNQRSMVRQEGMRQIERQSHHRLGGGSGGGRPKSRTPVPCSSEVPISPRTYLERCRKSSSSKENELRRKSSADVTDLATPRSSRYLLSDNPIFELLPESEHSSSSALVPSKPVKINHLNYDDFPVFRSSSARSYGSPVYQLPPSSARSSDLHGYKSPLSLPHSSDSHAKKSLATSKVDSNAQKSLSIYKQDSQANKSSSTRSSEQVVKLRVSIHCKGCEGKIRKHISRMEGVTSFSTDLATKKVTVVGNVTPLVVLTSISKVKYAEFWETPTSSSSSSSS